MGTFKRFTTDLQDMDPSAGIFARHSAYLERYVQIGVVGNRLIAVSFPTQEPASAGTDHVLLDTIERYLDGIEEEFDGVELALTVDTDTRAVLATIREIPYGHERDMATIARLTPEISEDDLETVHTALRENPVPPVIPDHRVSDGPHGTPHDVTRLFRELEGLD